LERTNQRTDIYGGKTLAERSRFAIEVIKEVRKQVGEDFAIIIRLSQWKPADYTNQLAKTPQELEAWLNPMADAGVDIFHCSQRRFWEAEYEGSDLNFAGWAKKVTGKATITVGSVGLDGEFLAAFGGASSNQARWMNCCSGWTVAILIWLPLAAHYWPTRTGRKKSARTAPKN
jgi:2,4-dienoyl-CoA reductase-like NADH-dependent reductase (Old Yellow Enzyme family)